MLYSILFGAAVGAGRSLYTVGKAEGMAVDWQKVIKTALIGAFVGGLAGYSGLTYEAMTESPALLPFLGMIDYCGTAATNVVLKRAIVPVWNWLKSKAGY
jgi:hypothetical protein